MHSLNYKYSCIFSNQRGGGGGGGGPTRIESTSGLGLGGGGGGGAGRGKYVLLACSLCLLAHFCMV